MTSQPGGAAALIASAEMPSTPTELLTMTRVFGASGWAVRLGDGGDAGELAAEAELGDDELGKDEVGDDEADGDGGEGLREGECGGLYLMMGWVGLAWWLTGVLSDGGGRGA